MTFHQTFAFLLFSLTLVSVANAENQTASQWEVTEISLKAAASGDADLSATFRHSTGKELKVPGFFDGGDQFAIRFTPPLPGEWKYTTQSDVNALNGVTGTVNAAAATPSN